MPLPPPLFSGSHLNKTNKYHCRVVIKGNEEHCPERVLMLRGFLNILISKVVMAISTTISEMKKISSEKPYEDFQTWESSPMNSVLAF